MEARLCVVCQQPLGKQMLAAILVAGETEFPVCDIHRLEIPLVKMHETWRMNPEEVTLCTTDGQPIYWFRLSALEADEEPPQVCKKLRAALASR